MQVAIDQTEHQVLEDGYEIVAEEPSSSADVDNFLPAQGSEFDSLKKKGAKYGDNKELQLRFSLTMNCVSPELRVALEA